MYLWKIKSYENAKNSRNTQKCMNLYYRICAIVLDD